MANLFQKDNFAGDWYGWLTNQISHIAFGMFIAVVVGGIITWSANTSAWSTRSTP